MTELKVLTADEQVANILAADARRVRRLTWLTVGLWGLTAVLTGLVANGILQSERRLHDTATRYWAERNSPTSDPQTADRMALTQLINHSAFATHLTLAVVGAVSLFSLTALGTVLLVHAGRRATLRQIQASLAAIAGQLAELKRPAGTIPPTAGG